MKKMTLLKVLLVLVLCVVGVGFYQGWFVLSSNSGSADTSNVEVNLKVDADKAEDDANAVTAKVREMTNQAAGKTPATPTPDDATVNEE